MKTLHLTDDLAGLSGVRSYLEHLREAMAPLDIECELAGPDGGSRFTSHLSRWFSLRQYWSLRRRLRCDPPDIVHAHNVWMRLSPAPLLAARQAGIPVVMTVHDYHLVCPRKWMITGADEPCASGIGPRCLVSNCRGRPEGWSALPYNWLRWLKVVAHRTMLRRWVDVFVAPSQHLASWLATSMGLTGVRTVPNFAPLPEGRWERPAGAAEIILFSGRLSREKGVHLLLDAMPIVLGLRPHVVLEVAGDGPCRRDLESRAERLGVWGSVRFLGALPRTQLHDALSRALVVVLPTLWMENCPVSVLEAMARARPVVATRIGGLPELVRHGETGILFERGNTRELAAGITGLLTAPARARAFGERAAVLHRELYSPRVHADHLAACYAAAAGRRTAR